MSEANRDDIRQLLRSFGIKADEAISAYVGERRPGRPLRLRIVLEDLTEYEAAPAERLHLEVEGEVRPGT